MGVQAFGTQCNAIRNSKQQRIDLFAKKSEKTKSAVNEVIHLERERDDERDKTTTYRYDFAGGREESPQREREEQNQSQLDGTKTLQ